MILYASDWTSASPWTSEIASINDDDIQGFMEVVYGLDGEELDLILHSPGGSAEVTENIVSYLRKNFKHIRVIIPQAAMSAATMLACSADEILMGKQSSIGPIDPQFVLLNQYGSYMQPAQAIIDNFEKAKEISVSSPQQLGAYVPILNQYPPGIIERCKNAQQLSVELVTSWLQKHMYRDDPDADNLSRTTAEYLADHENFKSHSRHIDKDRAEELGLKITPLEGNKQTQDLVLSVFHATTITFQFGALKIIENNKGWAFIQGNPHASYAPSSSPLPS